MIAALLFLLPQAAAPAVPAGEPRPFDVHGSFGLRWRTRWSGHDSDSDLAETLDLALGDPARDRVSANLSAEARVDLDGVAHGANSSAFLELEDTYGSAFAERVYEASLDLHLAGDFEILRAGRQTIVETPETAWFDGARAETRALGRARARLGAYGGVPVQLYPDAPASDTLYGAYAELRPWSAARLRADWMHAEDDPRFGARANDLWAARLSQSLGQDLRLEAEYSRLDERDRDVRARASWSASDSDFVLRASWYRLLEPQGELAQVFDPFSATLHELEPYQQFGLQFSKTIARHVQLQAGYDARRVTDAQDVGTFNHDYDRGFATLGFDALLPASVALSLTGEVWDTQQDYFRTLGAELSRTFDERLETALGTSFALYSYDLYQARELDHVRTYYLRCVLGRSAPLRLELRYQLEEDPIDTCQDLRLGATWRF